MVRIDVEGSDAIDAQAGTRLVLALEDAGIDILHRCGGNARCTTCRVEILAGDSGEMTELERTRLARVEDATPTTRLSCQILISEPIGVRVINRLHETDMTDAGPRPEPTIDPGK